MGGRGGGGPHAARERTCSRRNRPPRSCLRGSGARLYCLALEASTAPTWALRSSREGESFTGEQQRLCETPTGLRDPLKPRSLVGLSPKATAAVAPGHGHRRWPERVCRLVAFLRSWLHFGKMEQGFCLRRSLSRWGRADLQDRGQVTQSRGVQLRDLPPAQPRALADL